MRITGGVLLGRQVEVPKGVIRAAMDKMRESIFAILGDIADKSFLDLFSGSGVISLEAASRGANPIEAVEIDTQKRSTIIKNVSISPNRINCRFIAVELYVKRTKKHFDYIFCDPPFPYQYKWDLVCSIAMSSLMNQDSILMMHYPSEDAPTNVPKNLLQIDHRKYGRSIVDFWKKLS